MTPVPVYDCNCWSFSISTPVPSCSSFSPADVSVYRLYFHPLNPELLEKRQKYFKAVLLFHIVGLTSGSFGSILVVLSVTQEAFTQDLKAEKKAKMKNIENNLHAFPKTSESSE